MAGAHGVRLNRLHQASTREKIRVGAIVTRLTKHVEGKIELSATQVSAARILLDKSLPSLMATELTGEGGGPLMVSATQTDQKL